MITLVNAVQDVTSRVVRQARIAARGKPAEAGKQNRRLPDRQIEIRTLPAAIAMPYHQPPPNRSTLRTDQPAADDEIVRRPMPDSVNIEIRMIVFAAR